MNRHNRVKSPKLTAAYLINKVLDRSLFLNELLNNSVDGFPYKERQFITELVYGTIRNLRYIDFWIQRAFKKPLVKIEKTVLTLIRVTVYQTLFMTNREVWSVTHEASELMKKIGKKKQAGFVNFILREIQRIEPSEERLKEIVGEDRDLFLQVLYSYPEWLYNRIKNQVGERSVESYLSFGNNALGITLRVEGDEKERDKVLQMLLDMNVKAKKAEISPFGIYTDRAVNYNMIKDLGKVFIQDESSQLTVLEMEIEKGETVLDLCAAPGGKTFFLSHLTGDEGKVVAADVNRHRLQSIIDSIMKYKKKNIEVRLQDSTNVREEWVDGFNRVLIDSPCSAIGTLKRHPEVKWLKEESDPGKMAKLAEKILEVGSKYVKVNGILLFSVCTFTREETTEQVQKFLTKHSNFKIEKAYHTIGSIHDRRDEFFIAKMRRIR